MRMTELQNESSTTDICASEANKVSGNKTLSVVSFSNNHFTPLSSTPKICISNTSQNLKDDVQSKQGGKDLKTRSFHMFASSTLGSGITGVPDKISKTLNIFSWELDLQDKAINKYVFNNSSDLNRNIKLQASNVNVRPKKHQKGIRHLDYRTNEGLFCIFQDNRHSQRSLNEALGDNMHISNGSVS